MPSGLPPAQRPIRSRKKGVRRGHRFHPERQPAGTAEERQGLRRGRAPPDRRPDRPRGRRMGVIPGRPGGLPRDGPRRLHQVVHPADYGGAGFSMLDLAIAAEELTCVDVNVPTTLLATGLGLQPVIQYGTPEQKERFLRPFADDPEGDLLASYAFTDVAGGANFDSADPAGGMQTIARRDGDKWVITGEKHYTTNGTGWGRTGCELYTVV